MIQHILTCMNVKKENNFMHRVICVKYSTEKKTATPENGFIFIYSDSAFHHPHSLVLFKTVLTLCLCEGLHTLNWCQ